MLSQAAEGAAGCLAVPPRSGDHHQVDAEMKVLDRAACTARLQPPPGTGRNEALLKAGRRSPVIELLATIQTSPSISPEEGSEAKVATLPLKS